LTGLFYETLEHAQIVSRLVGHICYLKGKGTGWLLTDITPAVPYYVVYPNGDVVENKS
jgi:hypothetical protein